MELADWGRVLNLLLCLVCLTALGYKYWRHWANYSTRTKDFWWVLVAWTVAVLYGTVEQLGWSPFGDVRPVLVTFALFLTIKVTIRPNEVQHPTVTKEF